MLHEKKHENINKMNVKFPRKITISILETQATVFPTTVNRHWKGCIFKDDVYKIYTIQYMCV